MLTGDKKSAAFRSIRTNSVRDLLLSVRIMQCATIAKFPLW
jgi:hypothetical protein